MYNDLEYIEYLSKLSGFSKRKCRSVLKSCGGDPQSAVKMLSKLRESSFEVFLDRLISAFTGERGRSLLVIDGEKVIMSFPVILLIIILIVAAVPSWLIGGILLIFYAFDIDFTTKPNEQRNDGTVEKHDEEVTVVKNSENEDFDEITIE